MTVSSLHVSSEPSTAIDGDVLVIGVVSTDSGVRLRTEDSALKAMESTLSLIGVTAAVDELVRLPLSDSSARSLALIGLGNAPVTTNSLRYASGSAARQLCGVESIVIDLAPKTDAELYAVLEGAAIGAYSYTEYRSASLAKTKLPATKITVSGSSTEADELLKKAVIVATAVHTVRDLVNMPPSDLYPETLADAAVKLAGSDNLDVTVLAEKELEKGGFGGILGVGKGSTRGPRLVKIAYSPSGATTHLALVGKGITFDSGGLSLKQPVSMIGMKYDMTGAATVLSVIVAAAALQLNVRLTAWLCIAENMPSGTASRPNDVLRVRGGKTVEYLNTDAEGRLVLADGLVAACEENPDFVIDVATLTGASLVSLGTRYVGAMGDESLVASVVSAGTRVGETLWPMPLPDELRAMLNSDIADIANVKPGNTAAGMLIAGVFLKDFIGTTGEGDTKKTIPWAHLDIAGPASNGGSPFGFTGKGPTGVTVRALLALAEDISLA